jgi:hypothetical protein
VKGMANIFKWFKNLRRGPLIANLPPELAQCEDACNVGECSHGKWLTCENRIRRMREEINFSRTKLGDDSSAS